MVENEYILTEYKMIEELTGSMNRKRCTDWCAVKRTLPSLNNYVIIPNEIGKKEFDNMKSIIVDKINNINKNAAHNIIELHKNSVVAEHINNLNILDNFIKDQQGKNHIQSVCAKGCSKCCSDYFYISMNEYFTIKYFAIQNNIFIRLKEKGIKQYEELKRISIDEYNKLENSNLADISEINNDHKYIDKLSPCVILNNDECMLYEYRPYICRLFGTTFDQPICEEIIKKCKKFLSKKVDEKKLNKYIICKKTIGSDYINNSSQYVLSNGVSTVTRGYPLCYWLANDDYYIDSFIKAVSMDKKEFIKKLENSKQTKIDI